MADRRHYDVLVSEIVIVSARQSSGWFFQRSPHSSTPFSERPNQRPYLNERKACNELKQLVLCGRWLVPYLLKGQLSTDVQYRFDLESRCQWLALTNNERNRIHLYHGERQTLIHRLARARVYKS
jgi:hypothetical protein